MTNGFKHIRLCLFLEQSLIVFTGHMTVSMYTCAIKFALSGLEEIGVGVPLPNLTLKNTLFLP